MKTANVLFDGKTIQYTPNIYIEVCEDLSGDEPTTYDLRTSEGWTYNMCSLKQAHAAAIKAMAKEEYRNE